MSDRVVFLLGDLLDPLPEPVDILLGNLPYVAQHDAATLPVDVRLYEPEVALYSPDAGLQHIQRLIAEAPYTVRPARRWCSNLATTSATPSRRWRVPPFLRVRCGWAWITPAGSVLSSYVLRPRKRQRHMI